ncbi:MAG: sigma-70 family RNA polymerase sigma factor [Clostridia bacterium]|nr:sigma-70 family RNA polymerase sigma factor [Clostridia bacterium]
MSDSEIKSLYFARDERATDETARKYGALFLRIARGILSKEDAEECVNDAYLRLWNSIPPADPQNLMAYGAKTVRNVSLSRLEHDSAKKRGGDVLISELDECVPDGELDDGSLSESIDRFLRGLAREKRVIFVLRYFHGEEVAAIASRLGCGTGRIKTVLHRTRKELKAYLEKEGISL